MAPTWISKDRFGAKRLRQIADKLSPKKRELIGKHSAFSSLLNIAEFSVTNRLIDFVAFHTDAKLREFSYVHGSKHKRILFTKGMVSKVFGLRSGSKPVVLLTKSEQSDIRDKYKGELNRLPIERAITMLEKLNDEDEDDVIRSWDLLCVATVLNPGSGNMMPLDYIGSMADPKRTAEYDWDEHILDVAMAQCKKIQDKKNEELGATVSDPDHEFWISGPMPFLAIVYMDHLEYPPNSKHELNYSVPRICFVSTQDFKFVVQTDLNNLILNNKTVFGRRPFINPSKTPYALVGASSHGEEVEVNPSASLNEWLVFPPMQELEVPARFKVLYEKHKVKFASDIDSTLKTLGAGLRSMQSQSLASLLSDVDAAMRDGDASTVDFQTNVSQDTNAMSNNNKDTVGLNEEEDKDAGGLNDDIHAVQADKVEEEGLEAEVFSGAAKDDEIQGCEAKMDEVEGGKEVVDVGKEGGKDDADEFMSAGGATTDKPQQAVVIDSGRMFGAGGDGEEDDASSPVRNAEVPSAEIPSVEIPSPRRERVIEPGYWDSMPNFELSSQDWDPSKVPVKPSEISVSAVHSADDGPTIGADMVRGGKVDGSCSKIVEEDEEDSDDIPAAATPDSEKENPADKVTVDATDASTGLKTFQRKTRHKRARKDESGTAPAKKIKVSQDVSDTYSVFVSNSREFKAAPDGKKKKKDTKSSPPKPFISIGRYHCDYKSFNQSLRPRKSLDSQVMSVWCENFNKVTKDAYTNSNKELKKYAFSCYMTSKLIVSPDAFKPQEIMREFKYQNVEFNIMKNDLLFFPVVKNNHWIVCNVNLLYEQYHIFDSLQNKKRRSSLDEEAHNLFMNFWTLVQTSGISKVNKDIFTLVEIEHPQQSTLYDCGFFSMLFIEHFNAKAMGDFSNDCTAKYRMKVAADLIANTKNKGKLKEIMDAELV